MATSPGVSASLFSRVSIPSTVLSRELQGETVLLNLASGVYFSLDPVGTCIWRALRATGSLRDALAAVLEEFEVSETSAADDLRSLAGALAQHGLITT